ncbi:DUF2231 domain-containing protein [Actinoplanes sp. NPDC049596]|uniref:DUF2231 domain-containing protein n=1 Tax=unclassified Actinoplanes TaxID=2626549 RepID=UPI003447D9C0
MFDQINGLPVHALVLHAAVVFVPLLALAAVVYALVPRWRPKLGWALALLAVAAPVATFVAKESGTELYNRLIGQGMSGPGKEILDDHMGFGTRTFWFTLALGVASLVLVALTWRRTGRLPLIGEAAGAVVLVVLAVISGYYVYKTGDSGATAVWGTY